MEIGANLAQDKQEINVELVETGGLNWSIQERARQFCSYRLVLKDPATSSGALGLFFCVGYCLVKDPVANDPKVIPGGWLGVGVV